MVALTASVPRIGRRALVRAGWLLRGFNGDLVAERDRWFLWATVLFGGGIAIYFALPVEPRLASVLALAVAAVALQVAWRQGLAAVVVGGALVALATGLAAAKIRTEFAGGPTLTRPLYNTEVRGYVELVEPRPGRGQRITLRVSALGRFGPAERPVRVRVRIPAGAALRPGDAIRVNATLAAPALPSLPGDYDFARAAWFRGIGAVGYAIRRPQFDADAAPPPLDLAVWAAVERVRLAIGARIHAAVPGETGAIAAALINGERGGISDATNDAYRAAGIYHVLSISGLHMVIMAGAVFWAVRLLLALWPGLALRWPIRKIPAVAACVAALGYLLISGGAAATARSWVMISIGFIAMLADRPAIALRTVALSALLILAVFPDTLLDVGFQMSYAAVVALVAAYEEVRARMARVGFDDGPGPLLRFLQFFGGIVLSTVVAGLAVAPFSAYHFHQSQQYALLANLVAIPLCNLVVMPAALAALIAMPFGLEALPLAVMAWGIDLMTVAAFKVAAIPGAMLAIPAMPEAAFGLMVAGSLWLCLWRRRWRLGGLVLIALGVAIVPFKARPDLLVGHDGALVAIRGPDGQLVTPAIKGAAFEFKRWREHDGAPVARAVADSGQVFRCDAVGCVGRVAARSVAVPRHASALADDCRLADVVVVSWPRPVGCQPRLLLIDLYGVRDHGTHAVRLARDGAIVTTVAETRGRRPWARLASAASRTEASGTRALGSRLSGFAAPDSLGEGVARVRPEIEDDDPPSDPDGSAQ
ncbi:MAG: ComEC/Rec2 family competence protein [Hyphomicrobiaceae bacterium]